MSDSTTTMGGSMHCPMMDGTGDQGMQGMQGMKGMHGSQGTGQGEGQGQGMQGMKGMHGSQGTGQGQGEGQGKGMHSGQGMTGQQGMNGMGGGCMMMQGSHGAAADSAGGAMGHGMNGMSGGMGNKMSGGMGMQAGSGSSPQQPYSKAVLSAIEDALQDEYRSEALYERVIEDHGNIRPFSNIVNAERRHSAHLVALLQGHRRVDASYAIPESKWTAANSPSYDSIGEACTASVKGEEDNVALYDRLFAVDLPTEVRSTFEHLRAVSQEHHLPAFQRCAER